LNPVLQAQLKVPGPVEEQVALGEQLFVPPPNPVQLLIEVHAKPVPLYPLMQAHVYVPGPVEVQLDLPPVEQLFAPLMQLLIAASKKKCYKITKPEKKRERRGKEEGKEITSGACGSIEAGARAIAGTGSVVADTSVKARI